VSEDFRPRETTLAGKRAVVTGASQGLGGAIARALLRAGADVALCARTPADIASAAAALSSEFPGRKLLGLACDISSREQVDRFFAAAIERLGGIDAVINNAGVHGPIGLIDAVDWNGWEQAIAVDLLGTAYCCRRAIQHFKSQKVPRGRRKIVNVSGGGATTPQHGLSAYGAAKAGVVRLTETLALELRDFAIDVNAVAPGALRTRLMDELVGAGAGKIGADYHKRLEELHAKGGMSIDRAADFCVYLASEASDGLSGRLLSAAWDPWPFSEAAKRRLASSDVYTLRRIVPEDRGPAPEKKP
jgi:NAD(P)-dependent dehydrogenase (short-subunit alcohol dehydrogenase family)